MLVLETKSYIIILMKKIISLFIFLSIIFFLPHGSLSEEAKTKSLNGIEILTGFGWGKLKAKDNYNLIPLSVSFDFDLKPLVKKINFNPKTLLQFQIEPFTSFVSQPDTNLEAGTCFWLKTGLFPEDFKFQPYFKLGAGLDYMTQHTREQSTQFNFIEQLGAGIHYYFSKNTAFTLEGRWRHLSNAEIKFPNHGINTYFVVTGISYGF